MRKTPAILLAFLGACASSGGIAYDYSKEPDPRLGEYVIGVSDRLSIQVWRNPELTADSVVRPDGTITMPLVGDIKAEGRTPTQLRDEITNRLTKFIRAEGAVVTVAVTGVNSYSFVVTGNVEHPGVFSAQKYVTVLEAMQLAGGPNRFASAEKTKLVRRARDGTIRNIPIDYPAVLNGTAPQANLALMPGDQLFVP